jgi:3-hydroxyisobutyrate dehydrogenase-like beta-hydroxyacid dehydrogenase
MQRIGFIGVGVMGAPIARRLAKAGFALTVCDTNRDAVTAFGRAGAGIAVSPAECARLDIVFVLVLTDEQVIDVVLGADGLLGAIDAAAPPIVVVMSTVMPDTVKLLGAQLAQKGARLLDAPVSGGLDGAERGTLSVMVGGAAEDLEAARPALAIVGDRIAHCGALGAGVTTKILNNLIGVANWLLMAETMALGAKLGMDLDALTTVMDRGSGRNIATGNWPSRRALYETYAREGELLAANNRICRKDLSLALALAGRAGLSLPITAGLASVVDAISPASLQPVWSEISGK